ncbi:MAG: hypothetical protein KDB69_06885 [Acidimicrobiia bacterium]|nr:hypothetical protein [Acidimicrobiia bacterium]
MIPKGLVRTVTGDVPAGDLGVTYMHEHLIIDSPLVARRWPHIALDDVASAVDEVSACAGAGVGAMVDAMPAWSGRGPVRLFDISTATGVNIVMATGMHTTKYYEPVPHVLDMHEDALAAAFIGDIMDGTDANDGIRGEPEPTTVRSGIVKVATDDAGMTPHAWRLFAAAVETARVTGCAVLTHCEDGRGAIEQRDALADLGGDLHRVVMSHTDKVVDPGYHRDLLASGVTLEFDQALREREGAVGGTAKTLADLMGSGFEDQLMLGTDGARRSLWTSLGGSPGLAWMAGPYRRLLEASGIDETLQEKLFVENPKRVLASRGTEP